MKVVAVIVTYNRLELLKKSIDCALNQSRPLDSIVVVDNKSTDATAEYLAGITKKPKKTTIEILSLDKNYGGAGGFYYGMEFAYNHGADWIWIMDDDTLAEPTCLEELLNAESNILKNKLPEPGFLSSRVDWTDGNRNQMNLPGVNHGNWCQFIHLKKPWIRLHTASFVSLLVSRKAVKKCGYPVKEFFIWYDDWEYTARITQKFAAYFVPDSVAVHHTVLNQGAVIEHVDKNNIWKFKYGIRNQVSVLSRSKKGKLTAIIFILENLFRARKKSFSILFSILGAGLKGFFFRYHRYIRYPEN